MSQGRFFRQTWKGLTLQTREEHVTTFAYWNDKNDYPAGGLLNEEDLQAGKQGQSSCSIHSIRELPVRAGKTSVSGVHLLILLCGFPKALFTKNSLRCQCTAGVSGNVPLEKDIKNADSPPTARKMKEYTLLVYNLLSEILLPKPLPVCFLNRHG